MGVACVNLSKCSFCALVVPHVKGIYASTDTDTNTHGHGHRDIRGHREQLELDPGPSHFASSFRAGERAAKASPLLGTSCA